MTLSRRDLNVIQSLNSVDVEKTFSGLRPFVKRNGWVGKNNKYSVDTVKRIIAEAKLGSIQETKHLSQYIAASSVLHCGRWLELFGEGDPRNVARRPPSMSALWLLF